MSLKENRVSKSRPCRHCDSTGGYCLHYPDTGLELCTKEQIAEGWAKTSKQDANGYYYLMDETKKSQKPEEEIQKTVRPKAEKWFSYPNRQGEKFVGVQRVDDGEGNRKFNQTHVENGKVIWNLQGVDRSEIPIYRYAEIQQAIAEGKAIYIVEGEGKADQLWSLGLPATCNLGGSGKWQESDTQDVIGATKIILCPDRDEVGLKHIASIAAQIHALRPELPLGRMNAYPEYNWGFLPPNKGVDVGDWIESGATRFHIEAAIADYQPKEPEILTPADELREAIATLKAIKEPFERALLQQEISAKYKIRGDKLEELLTEIVSKEPLEISSMADLFSDVYLEIQDKAEHPENSLGITSGFLDIDALTGGWQKGDLITLAARPSIGKTSLALALSVNAAKANKNVGFISLEMSKKQLMYKIISTESRINNNNLSRGSLADHEWVPVANAGLEIGKLPLKILDSGITSHSDIAHKARYLKKSGLDLLVIDYLQLLSSDSDNENVAIGRITRSLKLLAMELEIPIIILSQLSRAVESRQNKRPMLSDLRSSGCLTGDTLIYMADTGERVEIKELEGTSNFNVWSLNQKTLKLEKARVSNAFCTGVKQTFTLKTRLGKSIRATGNHKFLTLNGWVPLSEITLGDRIAIPREIPDCGTNGSMSLDEMALLAHLIGDGCVLPSHSIQYTTGCQFLAQLVTDIANRVFGDKLKIRISPEKNWFQVYFASTERLTHGKHNPVLDWFKTLGVYDIRSHQKFVPVEVFRHSKNSISNFLGHLWATDGHIGFGKNNTIGFYYSTSSERLANDVQSLLLRVGVISVIRRIPQGKSRDNFNVCVSGKSDILIFLNTIELVSLNQISASHKIIEHYENTPENTNKDVIPKSVVAKHLGWSTASGNNYSRARLLKVAIKSGCQELKLLANSDLYWDEIKSIEIDISEKVYDLTVPANANFLANDIVVHNSIEQDSDIVIMMYRDEYYNPDSQDRGITEVIFSKHRNGATGVAKLIFTPRFSEFKNVVNPRIADQIDGGTEID